MKWQTKNNGKDMWGMHLSLIHSCCKYNDTAAGESGERNENSCNYL